MNKIIFLLGFLAFYSCKIGEKRMSNNQVNAVIICCNNYILSNHERNLKLLISVTDYKWKMIYESRFKIDTIKTPIDEEMFEAYMKSIWRIGDDKVRHNWNNIKDINIHEVIKGNDFEVKLNKSYNLAIAILKDKYYFLYKHNTEWKVFYSMYNKNNTLDNILPFQPQLPPNQIFKN